MHIRAINKYEVDKEDCQNWRDVHNFMFTGDDRTFEFVLNQLMRVLGCKKKRRKARKTVCANSPKHGGLKRSSVYVEGVKQKQTRSRPSSSQRRSTLFNLAESKQTKVGGGKINIQDKRQAVSQEPVPIISQQLDQQNSEISNFLPKNRHLEKTFSMAVTELDSDEMSLHRLLLQRRATDEKIPKIKEEQYEESDNKDDSVQDSGASAQNSPVPKLDISQLVKQETTIQSARFARSSRI